MIWKNTVSKIPSLGYTSFSLLMCGTEGSNIKFIFFLPSTLSNSSLIIISGGMAGSVRCSHACQTLRELIEWVRQNAMRSLHLPVSTTRFHNLKKNICIYLVVPGLSCCMWDLVPWPGVENRALHWEHGVSARGPPGSPRFQNFSNASHPTLAQQKQTSSW